MKKLYSLFALIALLFTASGCEDGLPEHGTFRRRGAYLSDWDM